MLKAVAHYSPTLLVKTVIEAFVVVEAVGR